MLHIKNPNPNPNPNPIPNSYREGAKVEDRAAIPKVVYFNVGPNPIPNPTLTLTRV